MKNIKVLPIALSVFALILSGCGEDNDSIFGSSSNNEFDVSRFERSANAIARIDTEYSNGERDIDKTNIKGNYNQLIDDLPSSTVLADNFEGTLEDRYIEVNGRTIKRPIYEKNTNNKFNYEIIYRTLNLSGVKASDYSAGNDFGGSRGIFTDLNNYIKIPSEMAFPAGSVCYIPVTFSDRAFFAFNDKNKTGYQELDKWTTATENLFSDNRQFRTIRVKVGASNKYQAVQVTFFATNNDPEFLYHGVDYDKAIYQANYVARGSTKPNENSLRGVVDCTLVNEVAADFLEREIKRYY